MIQARGAIGERSLVDAIAHADRFVELIPAGRRVGRRPRLRRRACRLGDRLASPRCQRDDGRATGDAGRSACAGRSPRWAWASGRRCVNVDVAAVCRRLARASFDVVTARSFGDVPTTTRVHRPLLATTVASPWSASRRPTAQRHVDVGPRPTIPRWSTTGVYQGIRRLTRRQPASTVSRETLPRRIPSSSACRTFHVKHLQAPCHPPIWQHMLRYHAVPSIRRRHRANRSPSSMTATESAAENRGPSAAPGDCRRQPEGRRRQDDHHDQPRRLPRRDRLSAP